jgi:hypothetical protein
MPYAKTSLRAEKRALRDKMRSLGLGYDKIAAEFARRYRLRPRAALREAYGWSLTEAARRINSHTAQIGLDPNGISAMSASHLCEYENWPGHGPEPTGRRPRPYTFALLASIYGCTVQDLVDLADREHLPPADLLILDKYIQNAPGPGQPATAGPAPVAPIAGPDRRAGGELRLAEVGSLEAPPPAAGPAALPPVAYRRIQEPDSGCYWIEREVLMTAHEGSEHAEGAERRDIGDATLEQLRADLVRLSRGYMTGEPFPLLLEARRVRSRIYAVLDYRLWPRDQTELYTLVGCLNGLMAVIAKDLGYPHASDELIRAGWAYAVAIDHHPLMAWLRLNLADVAYWSSRPRQAAFLAESGLRYMSVGPTAADLHLMYGRASARLGDATAARRAIATASEAREHGHHDELLEIGGEFRVSRATQHYHAGFALIEIPDAEAEAASELERAIDLYAAGPDPGEDHSQFSEMLARANLSTARLRAGQIDAAIAAVEPVLTLPSAKRIDLLPQCLAAVRTELARRRYQGSPQARELDERIEDFGRETIVGDLRNLPTGAG